MADGRKSVFKRPEQLDTPTLGPDAERFVHGVTQGPTADAPAELKRGSTGMNPRAEDTPVEHEPMKRLTIDIPLSLHKRVKSQCANRGTTIAEVVRKYLEKSFPDPESRKGG